MFRTHPALLIPAALISVTLLAGCAQQGEAPEIETEAPKTIEQYLEQFTELKDPAELQLAAGASAEEFGPWITGLNQEWKFAGCTNPRDIIDASIELGITDDRADFYPRIAEANADAPTIAMFGTNWPSNSIAVRWRDAAIKTNATGIDYCVQGIEDEAVKEEYVSAAEVGKNSDGYPIFDVIVNVVPGPHSNVPAGERVYTYDTSQENGNLIVESFAVNGNQF